MARNRERLDPAVAYLEKKGALLVMAAGNLDDNRIVDFSDDILFVNPYTEKETRWENHVIIVTDSKYNSLTKVHSLGEHIKGKVIDLAARDTNMDVVLLNDKVGPSNGGTSFSTPLVTGTAALLKYLDNKLSPYEIKEIIYNSGWKVDGFPTRVLRADKAVDFVLGEASIAVDDYIWVAGDTSGLKITKKT